MSKFPILEEEPAQEERGCQNPHVIDLISHSSDSDIVELQMIETRGWEGGSEQAKQIEEKFNNYLEYCLGGHLVAQFPQYQEKKVSISLVTTEKPYGWAEKMLAAMTSCAHGYDLSFEVRLSEDPLNK